MRITLFAFLALLLIGCGEKTITNTIITPGAAVGEVVGKVKLNDSLGYPLKYHGDVTITIENSHFAKSVKSDSAGQYIISDVPTGIYTITTAKNGFSRYKSYNILFPANGTLYYTGVQLYSIIEATADLSLAAFTDYTYYKDSTYSDSSGIHHKFFLDTLKNFQTRFKCVVDSGKSDIESRGVAIYFGRVNSFDSYDPQTYLFSRALTDRERAGRDSYFFLDLLKSDLYNAGFSYGDKVYCCAFAGSTASVNSGKYFDLPKDMYVYGVGKAHSEIKSFICP